MQALPRGHASGECESFVDRVFGTNRKGSIALLAEQSRHTIIWLLNSLLPNPAPHSFSDRVVNSTLAAPLSHRPLL